VLERAVRAGDPQALYALGLWRLEGRHLARDLGGARSLVESAEGAGVLPAARTLAAFVALGIGAAPDWSGSIAVLERWSERDPVARRQLNLIAQMTVGADGTPQSAARPEQLSERPWVARLPAFLTADEAAFLREAAEGRYRPTPVFSERERRFVVHPYRDATAASFPVVLEWPVVHAINRRIAFATGTEVAQGEPLQVLRYEPGQQYRPHLDAVPGLANQRTLTVLIALSDDFDGGATEFPEASLALRGRVGDAILFRNVDADGRPDRASLHAGAPVTSGVKLIASRWIRAAPPPEGESFGAQEVLPREVEAGQ
jgi:prolyl 4-hydroxylase